MAYRYRSWTACVATALLMMGIDAGSQSRSSEDAKERHKAGHSRLGEAFDEGPREKPTRIDGIGVSRFPITAKNPDVQVWFDQGHTLLHSYWFFEAERAFRWCVKLDPDAPMPYWGLARAVSGERGRSFMNEASRRKDRATPRERDYIEAWEPLYNESLASNERQNRHRRALEQLILKYPTDIEAKALYGEAVMGNNRVGTDLILRQVLATAPDHPGAHHYRIHNWDDEDGVQALDSCRKYGEIVFGIGHALHMPGHIQAGLGMFHEAAISLDAATRAEIAYMGRQMVFPYNTWNYAHNRNYLSYVQEQLGLPSEAIRGARELLAVPLDPSLNDATRFSPHWQGVAALTRALVKFERWDEILAPSSIPWGTSVRDRLLRGYAEAMAHAGRKDVPALRKAAAALAAMKADVQKPENRGLELQHDVQSLEVEAALAMLQNDPLRGLGLLAQAAPKEIELRRAYDDPPAYPNLIYRKLGDAYLDASSPALAAIAYERTLEIVPNDPFALSGLARARYALKDVTAARAALGRLLYVWSDAEPGLRWMTSARATGVQAVAADSSPGAQRNYRKTSLDRYGSAIWEPFAAPALDARSSDGTRTTLDQFRGKNVILVFHVGLTCTHCRSQLKSLAGARDRWTRLNAEVLAVGPDTLDALGQPSAKEFNLRLLSDDQFANARRFKSYDDFEEIPIHSTILIDGQGRVQWARHGGAPFTDLEFLAKQLERINERGSAATDRTTAPR
jgi:peroxiredoxin